MKKDDKLVAENIKIKSKMSDLNPKGYLKRAGFFWLRYYGLFFVIIFVLVSAFSVYLLYEKVYLATWSEEEKREYVASKQKTTILKKDKFDEIIKNIQKRKNYSQQESKPIENIFKEIE